MPGPPGSNLGLCELAKKLVAEGPVKQEVARRRVRGLLGGAWLFDTLEAQYVWEHPYFPFFYIPLRDVEDAGKGEHFTIKPRGGQDATEGFVIADIFVDLKDEPTEAIIFEGGRLDGLVKIPHGALDMWFVEDERLQGIHPKDPYRRIDCHASSREIRIEVDSILVAKSTNNVSLYETGLKPRYYLSLSSVLRDTPLLTKGLNSGAKSLAAAKVPILLPSDTKSVCPYKGQASYYHLQIGEKIIEDVAWYYPYPTLESAPIQNRVCFYNEKVDVFVDGVKEEKWAMF